MSISIGRHAIEGYEPVPLPRRGTVTGSAPTPAVLQRRPSAQPSRRAVLHVQGAGDPSAPADLADWFTQRAFHFYLVALRLPSRITIAGRPNNGSLDAACAELDVACARLRQDEGMSHIIVTAQDRGAHAAARWSAGQGMGRADALVLYEPELPSRPPLNLNISCPVLVVAEPGSALGAATPGGTQGGGPGAGGRWPLRPRRNAAGVAAGAPYLGGHVTWLELPVSEPDEGRRRSPVRRPAFFDELGRWLGAYMYGTGRDQLL